jgi:ABC-type uncharacterized transport system ATPase subunit
MLELKRDRGAAVVLSAERLSDLTSLCDSYLALEDGRATLVRAQDVPPVGAPTADALASALDRAVSRVR